MKNTETELWSDKLKGYIGTYRLPVRVVYCMWCVCGSEADNQDEAMDWLHSHYTSWHPMYFEEEGVWK